MFSLLAFSSRGAVWGVVYDNRGLGDVMVSLILMLSCFQFRTNRIGHIRSLTDLDFKVQPMSAVVTKECRDQLVTK